MEHEIQFGNSNRENGPTLLDSPLFPGIFQRDEPTKRFPFSTEPKLPKILTKWKALCIYYVYRNRSEAPTTKLMSMTVKLGQHIWLDNMTLHGRQNQMRHLALKRPSDILPTPKRVFTLSATYTKTDAPSLKFMTMTVKLRHPPGWIISHTIGDIIS